MSALESGRASVPASRLTFHASRLITPTLPHCVARDTLKPWILDARPRFHLPIRETPDPGPHCLLPSAFGMAFVNSINPSFLGSLFHFSSNQAIRLSSAGWLLKAACLFPMP